MPFRWKPKALHMYGSPQCTPCHAITPKVQQFASDSKLEYIYSDVMSAEGSVVAARANIQSVPTLVVEDGHGDVYATGVPAIQRLMQELRLYYITGE